ncbi:MAG: hypothetical protein ACRD5W_10115 [Candidatus Acidiferrales bacterium]
MEQSFVFGSVAGSTFAAWFFGAMSLFIGYAAFELASNTRWRRDRFRSVGVLPRWQGFLLGALLMLLVASAVYMTALSGFYGLSVKGDEIRLHYALPSRTLALRRGELAEARSEPQFRARWRLYLYTPTGGEFVSAQASYAEVRSAASFLRRYLAQPPEDAARPIAQP